MTLPDHQTNELYKHRRALKAATAALKSLPREREQALAAIARDDELTDEEKEVRSRKVKREARERFERLKSEANNAFDEGMKIRRSLRVTRRVDPNKQATARALLDRGLAPSAIRERAREVGDVELLAALRTELLFLTADPGTGVRKGAQFIEAGDVLEQVERDLAELGTGNEAESQRTAVEIRDLAKPLPELTELAALVVTDAGFGQVATARMKAGHAINDAGGMEE